MNIFQYLYLKDICVSLNPMFCKTMHILLQRKSQNYGKVRSTKQRTFSFLKHKRAIALDALSSFKIVL